MLDVELSLCRRMSCLFEWNVFIGYPVYLLCRCPGLAAKQPKARVIAERFGSWLKLSDDLCLLTESFHQLGWSAVPREVRATKVFKGCGKDMCWKSDFLGSHLEICYRYPEMITSASRRYQAFFLERFESTSGGKMLPLMLKALTCNCLIVTKPAVLPCQE